VRVVGRNPWSYRFDVLATREVLEVGLVLDPRLSTLVRRPVLVNGVRFVDRAVPPRWLDVPATRTVLVPDERLDPRDCTLVRDPDLVLEVRDDGTVVRRSRLELPATRTVLADDLLREP
jgi:hypothetical protein